MIKITLCTTTFIDTNDTGFSLVSLLQVLAMDQCALEMADLDVLVSYEHHVDKHSFLYVLELDL